MISLGTVTVKLNLPLLFYRKFAKRQGQLSKVTCKPARPQQPGVTKQHTKRPPPLAPSVFYVFFFSCAHDSPPPCALFPLQKKRKQGCGWPLASFPAYLPTAQPTAFRLRHRRLSFSAPPSLLRLPSAVARAGGSAGGLCLRSKVRS